MPITINGSGTVTGITAGGLPDGVITTDDIAANAVTYAKIGTTEQGQLCKAWIRKNSGFDGLGNGIMGSYNVSSITQLSTGRFQVNFTNAISDTNYAVVLGGFRLNSDVVAGEDASNRTTTYCTVVSYNISQTRFDMGFSAAIFR